MWKIFVVFAALFACGLTQFIISEISLDLLNSSINDIKTEYEEKFENKCKINYVKVVKYD